MVNHGLVVAPLLFIVGAARAARGGSEDIREMGGIAFRAPVLATLFLIVALATLAMPGSSNFVGEFLILLGVFKAKLAIAVIAFSGVVMASVYALRLFIRAMHNRVGAEGRARVRSRSRDGLGARAAGRGDPVPRALPAARAAPQRRVAVLAAAVGLPTHSARLTRPRSLAAGSSSDAHAASGDDTMTVARHRTPERPARRLRRALAADRAARRRGAGPARRAARLATRRAQQLVPALSLARSAPRWA